MTPEQIINETVDMHSSICKLPPAVWAALVEASGRILAAKVGAKSRPASPARGPHGVAYFCADFTGHYPVGAAAVCTAGSVNEARKKFAELFRECKLPQPDNDWTVHPIPAGAATMLVDGDY